MTKKKCFVIGPIGDTGSPVRADADDFMKYIVSPCLAQKEFDYDEPIRADKLNEPGRITSQIIKLLMEADLVIADLTTNNANVYYELSLRHAIGKPAIHMALDGTQISFDLHDNRTIFYTMHSRIAERARGELTQQIRKVHEKNYKATNPIVETAGIIKLEQSTDPIQNALGTVANTVASLAAEVSSLRSILRDVQFLQTANNNFLAGGTSSRGVGAGGFSNSSARSGMYTSGTIYPTSGVGVSSSGRDGDGVAVAPTEVTKKSV
jgi:hypothetical protein